MRFTKPLFKNDTDVRNGHWLIGEKDGKLNKVFCAEKLELLPFAFNCGVRPLYFIRVKVKRDEVRLAA